MAVFLSSERKCPVNDRDEVPIVRCSFENLLKEIGGTAGAAPCSRSRGRGA
jgi:hypothetical protein